MHSKLALVQGPPGTGKTYIARTLIRFLVEREMRKVDEGEEMSLNILVMAYNRWEALFADDANLHLSLLYIAIGFFG